MPDIYDNNDPVDLACSYFDCVDGCVCKKPDTTPPLEFDKRLEELEEEVSKLRKEKDPDERLDRWYSCYSRAVSKL